MIFVETTCGEAVRLDAVRELRPAKDDGLVVLLLEGGSQRTATWDKLTAAQCQAMLHVSRAEPGTYILHTDDHGELLVREPVIAWAVTNMGLVYPVTSSGFCNAIDANPLIQHPDGTVQDVLGIHQSYEQWLRDLRADYAFDLETVEAAKRPPN